MVRKHEEVRRLKVGSIVYGHTGLPDFALIYSKQYDKEVSLVAFDLLELDGEDVRKKVLLDRKKRLAKLIARLAGTTNSQRSLLLP
jgi:ATP-dependent DNA ligase